MTCNPFQGKAGSGGPLSHILSCGACLERRIQPCFGPSSTTSWSLGEPHMAMGTKAAQRRPERRSERLKGREKRGRRRRRQGYEAPIADPASLRLRLRLRLCPPDLPLPALGLQATHAYLASSSCRRLEVRHAKPRPLGSCQGGPPRLAPPLRPPRRASMSRS